jgi:hypothetical protein
MIAFKGGASEPSDTLLPGKAGGAVAVRRTLASTICRIIDPTLASRPRQLRDASTVMRFRPAHQSMINRRLDDRAPCRARQSLKEMLPRKPRIHSPAPCEGGHESGLIMDRPPFTRDQFRAPLIKTNPLGDLVRVAPKSARTNREQVLDARSCEIC